MRIESLAPETFVPKWKKNQDLPENEQMKVTVQFPSSEEYEPYGSQAGKPVDAIGVVKKFTKQIDAFEIVGKVVTTGEELVSQPHYLVSGLVTEIFLYIAAGSEIGAEREKN